MTELSFPWTCEPAIGDASTYDLEIVEARSRILGNLRATTDGVVYWTDTTVFPDITNPTDGLLEPEFVSGNTVRINTGIGMVQGWLYFNDVDIDTDVSGGNANAVDIIGLRRDLAGQTVRLFHGRGAASSTYSLVQTTATWEVPLVEVTLDGSGNYSSLEDVRRFVRTPFFPVQQMELFKACQYGFNNNTFTTLTRTLTYQQSSPPGVGLNNTQETYGEVVFNVPQNILGGEVDVEWYLTTSTTGNLYLDITYVLTGSITVNSAGFAVVAAPTGIPDGTWTLKYTDLSGGTPISVNAGDIIRVGLWRDASDVSDTYPDTLLVMGARLLWNGQYSETFNPDLAIV